MPNDRTVAHLNEDLREVLIDTVVKQCLSQSSICGVIVDPCKATVNIVLVCLHVKQHRCVFVLVAVAARLKLPLGLLAKELEFPMAYLPADAEFVEAVAATCKTFRLTATLLLIELTSVQAFYHSILITQ